MRSVGSGKLAPDLNRSHPQVAVYVRLFGTEEEVGQVKGKRAGDHVQTFVSIGCERQPLRPHPLAITDLFVFFLECLASAFACTTF